MSVGAGHARDQLVRTGVDPERDAAHARSHAHDHISRRMIRTVFACTHTPQHARGCDSRCLRCGRVAGMYACIVKNVQRHFEIYAYANLSVCVCKHIYINVSAAAL